MKAVTLSSPEVRDTHHFAAGLWRLADPKISLASIAAMFLGLSAAAAAGPLNWGWLALTVIGILAIETAKNASGEIFDYDSGVDLAVKPRDRSPFSGGKRVLVDGVLTRGETAAISAAGYTLGIGIGFFIAAVRAPSILWIGIAGVLLAFEYHAPPLRLSYRGLGELAVAVCYGPLITLGAYLVQTSHAPLRIVLLAAPLGLLIAGFLWVNEFPDYEADKGGGKQTLVVRLGRGNASRCFAGIELLAFAVLAALPFFGVTPWVLLGLAGLIPSLPAILELPKHFEEIGSVIRVQRSALAAFVVTALGQGIGLLARF